MSSIYSFLETLPAKNKLCHTLARCLTFFFNSLPSHYLLYDPFISPFPPSSFIQAWHCGFDNMVHLVSHSNSQLSATMFLAFCVLHGKIGNKVISATESKTKTVMTDFSMAAARWTQLPHELMDPAM